jgi:hypothetical protein
MMAKLLGVLVVMGSVLGCAADPQGEGASDKSEPAGNAAAVSPTDAALARVQMDAPAGWAANARGPWRLHQAGDRRAHLAVSGLGAGEAVAARVREALAAMGGSDPRTAEEQAVAIGPEKLPGRAASGNCRLGAEEARMQYIVVDVGEGARVLVVFAAAKDAPEEAQRTAFTALATMRRK